MQLGDSGRRCKSSLPFVLLTMRAVPSADTQTMQLPSGENKRLPAISRPVSSKLRSSLPVATSHTRVLVGLLKPAPVSESTESSSFPSDEKVTDNTFRALGW